MSVPIATGTMPAAMAALVPEDEPPNPVSLYGYLKAASELVVLHRARDGFVARVGGQQQQIELAFELRGECFQSGDFLAGQFRHLRIGQHRARGGEFPGELGRSP